MHLFLLHCPKCGHDMKYHTYDKLENIAKKKKKCVYCGYTMNVRKTITKKL